MNRKTVAMLGVLAVGAVGIAILGASESFGDIAVTFSPGGTVSTDMCVHRRPDGGLWFDATGFVDGGTLTTPVIAIIDPYTGNGANAMNNALDGPAFKALVRASRVGDAGAP